MTYGKLVDSNGLLEYVSAVEKEFRIDERVLKESLNSAIEKADSENVRIILKKLITWMLKMKLKSIILQK